MSDVIVYRTNKGYMNIAYMKKDTSMIKEAEKIMYEIGSENVEGITVHLKSKERFTIKEQEKE